MALTQDRPEYFRRNRPCDQEGCKAKRFYLDEGFVLCKNGHRQEEGLQTRHEDEDFRPRGQKTKIKKQTEEKPSQTYRGISALELFLQAYQLILWKQCHALVNTIGLPAELEVIVRDLWALRFQLLKDRYEAGETYEDAIFSSQPINEETELEPQREGRWTSQAMPSLIETLAICYIATILLRLPLSMGELHRYAVREDLPYVRAVRFVPAAMKKRLPAEFMLALDTAFPLKRDQLRKAIHNICLLYQKHFQLEFPTLNMPLLLYRHVRDLALPVHIFQAVGKIANLLSIDFSFPKPERQQRISRFPEMALISLLVIAVKLYHPFSNVELCASSTTDPALLNVNWESWLASYQAHKSRRKDPEHLTRGAEIDVIERDVMTMNGTQLDDYLEWYERTWIDEERTQQKTRGLPTQLLEMFPTGRHDGSQPKTYDTILEIEKEQASLTQRLTETMGNLRMRKVVDSQERDLEADVVPKVGSGYKRYRSIDELNRHARAFHEAAADAVAVKVETLLISVLQIERKLVVWREKQIRANFANNAERGNNNNDEEMIVPGEQNFNENVPLQHRSP